MAALGDIVSIKGESYAVAEFLPHPNGGRMVRCVKHGSGHRGIDYTGIVKDEVGLLVIDSPVFEIGERVWVDGNQGSVQSSDDTIVRVLMDAWDRPLKKDLNRDRQIRVQIDAAIASVPRWKLVLDNRLP